VFAFWFAYVLTRPVGASFADWFGKPRSVGGLGVGSGLVSVLLAVAIAGFVAYLAHTKIDTADGRWRGARRSEPDSRRRKAIT
jgi:uncharacterized membrane-anchored protein